MNAPPHFIKPQRPAHITDPLEQMVATALDEAGIEYVHESQITGQRHGFLLTKRRIYIEVKRFHTDRVTDQLALADNVILLQGIDAVSVFCQIVKDSA